MSDAQHIIIRTSAKNETARRIMKELDGKVSPRLGKPYKVIFED